MSEPSLTGWRVYEPDVPGVIELVALVGSHAYGTSHADSDEDYRGFYVAPTDMLFALDSPMQTFDRQEPDLTLHEVGKFVKLAAAANPTILEVLFAPSCHCGPIGRLLRDNAELFLSCRVMHTYGGYANGQFQRAIKGSGGSRGQAHLQREKFVLHTYRLMLAGIAILETGTLTVRVDDPEALWTAARQPLERVSADFERLNERLRRARAGSALPEEPPRDAINELLRTIRHAYLAPRRPSDV